MLAAANTAALLRAAGLGDATTQSAQTDPGEIEYDVPVPSFGPRMVSTRCGIIGADATYTTGPDEHMPIGYTRSMLRKGQCLLLEAILSPGNTAHLTRLTQSGSGVEKTVRCTKVSVIPP